MQRREHHSHIILTFRESPSQADIGFAVIGRWKRCWTPCTDGYHRIFYRLEGESSRKTAA
ncbi:YjbD family protein [Escherichia coli]|nr:YjbD family protein [Escherichia coli]